MGIGEQYELEKTGRIFPEHRRKTDKNRELHELLGLCWHEVKAFYSERKCTKCGLRYSGSDSTVISNPDYATDPRLVLREMDKHPKGKLFYAWLMYRDNAEAIDDDGLIERDYMTDQTGKLCSRAIEFLKGVGR